MDLSTVIPYIPSPSPSSPPWASYIPYNDLREVIFTHPSYSSSSSPSPSLTSTTLEALHKTPQDQNLGFFAHHRLAFLGDAILQASISKFLFEAYPGDNEGALTMRRSLLVCNKSLQRYAEYLSLGSYLRRGPQIPLNTRVLSTAFEALLGGIYLCQGELGVDHFLQNVLGDLFRDILNKEYSLPESHNPIKLFQELIQKYYHINPIYDVTVKTNITAPSPQDDIGGPREVHEGSQYNLYTINIYIPDLIDISTIVISPSRSQAMRQAIKEALTMILNSNKALGRGEMQNILLSL